MTRAPLAVGSSHYKKSTQNSFENDLYPSGLPFHRSQVQFCRRGGTMTRAPLVVESSHYKKFSLTTRLWSGGQSVLWIHKGSEFVSAPYQISTARDK
ncbi:hypothetical protein F2Q70_00036754 [Brassica cretica]|uniref:Uncharacterized protein n=1 Tax=Brassica cretica TaxID=69181 RepID=A0A8S9JWB5_BRACR|nr:hypothetical protein F2Q70_00036754 [Brassica cretica]